MNGLKPKFLEFAHLTDSALPVGGFAFSNGLESAYHLGYFQSSEQLSDYLTSVLWTTASSELPFIHSCYLRDDLSDLVELCFIYDAMVTAPANYRASITQGRNWLRIMQGLYPNAKLEAIASWLKEREHPYHFTVVFALTMNRVGFLECDAKQIFMYQFLRDQMSAAIRLGVLGPLEATQRQKRLYDVIHTAITDTMETPFENATRGAPQWDIAQSYHEHLYSRLFQS